jgi:plastocyanin domain-containing protein
MKYIRSKQKDVNGKTIYSGQLVSVHGRFNPREIVEVDFGVDFGFRIQGNNFADAYDIKIEKDITLLNKLCGSVRFLFYNLTGM